MDARHPEWIEQGVDVTAATILGAAAAYALLALGWSAAVAAVAGGALLLCAWRMLGCVVPELPIFTLPAFEAVALPEPVDSDELMLNAADRLDAPGELLLDDVVAKLEDFSRVVRLFDSSAMPTSGELQGRIDRHLDGSSSAAPPDASQALHVALSELRRTLR